MKSETRAQQIPKDKAKRETTRLVKDTKQEIRSIASRSSYDAIDVLEIFVGNLLRRTGVLDVRK